MRGMGTLRVRGWVCWPVFLAVVIWWFLGERKVLGECKWPFFCGGECRVSVECEVGVVSFIMCGHCGLRFLLRDGISEIDHMVRKQC